MSIEALLTYKAAIIGVWFVVLFITERAAAAARAPQSKNRLFRNAGLWLIILVASPLIVAPIAALGANQILWTRPPEMTVGATAIALLALDIILLDIWTYWLHRAYHRIPFLWRFHEVHHRDEFLDSTSAVRFHLGEVVISAALRLIPIAIFATPLTTVIIFEIVLLASALFHHSNLALPASFERALSKIIVTPSIHWVHHHAVDQDTNSNFASFLSVWDWVFKSRSRTKRLQGMKIGLEGLEDQPLIKLILMPLRRYG